MRRLFKTFSSSTCLKRIIWEQVKFWISKLSTQMAPTITWRHFATSISIRCSKHILFKIEVLWRSGSLETYEKKSNNWRSHPGFMFPEEDVFWVPRAFENSGNTSNHWQSPRSQLSEGRCDLSTWWFCKLRSDVKSLLKLSRCWSLLLKSEIPEEDVFETSEAPESYDKSWEVVDLPTESMRFKLLRGRYSLAMWCF